MPLLTLGAPQHALAADVHLRPLLIELGATTPTASVTLLDSDLLELPATVESRARDLAAAIRPAPELVLT